MSRSSLTLSTLIFLALQACTPAASPFHTPASAAATPTPPVVQSFSPDSISNDVESPSSNTPPAPVSSQPTSPDTAIPTDLPLPAGTPVGALSYRYWRWWPIIPVVTATTYQIYQRGLELGADRHAFSIIGDCQSMPPVFGGRYDHPGRYQLPRGYEYLQDTIDRFAGSFDRASVTVQNGFSVTAALSPLWADPDICQAGETPVDCELRLHHPIFVFIALGTNWTTGAAERHNQFLEQIIDRVIAAGAVPILSTKGDNEEGDHSLNLGIAEIAAERDLPLWNYWRAIQELPNHGLDIARDGNYLSIAAWDVRSFSSLQVLDLFWRALDPDGQPDPLQHSD